MGTAHRTRAPSAARNKPFRLRGTGRRLVLLLHLVAALGWLGVDVVIAVLAVLGFRADDPTAVAAAYTALEMFAVPLLLVLGVTTLGSGLLIALGSGWGLLRYWWVALKLAINLVLTGLVLVLLRPRVSQAAEESERIDSTLTDRLGEVPFDLLFPGFVSGTALLAAAALGVFKPFGRIPRRRG